MKHYLLLLILLFLSGCDICEPVVDFARDPHCEYNPSKAGADIVEQYYITNLLQEKQRPFSICFDEYENKFYFIARSAPSQNYYIYTVDKLTMKLERKKRIYSSVYEFTIHNNKILFPETESKIFCAIDLSDNTVEEIDTVEMFGLDINDIIYFGVDRATDRFYLNKKGNILQFFTYDETNSTYSANESISISSYKAYNLRLYGNSIYRYFSTIKINGDCPAYIYIHNLSDVSIIEKKINLNYLNSAAVYNVLYDGEFIWTITEDEDRNLQLLKLKLL